MEVPTDEILNHLTEHLNELQNDIRMILEIIKMLSHNDDDIMCDSDDEENEDYQYDMYRAKSLLYSS